MARSPIETVKARPLTDTEKENMRAKVVETMYRIMRGTKNANRDRISAARVLTVVGLSDNPDADAKVGELYAGLEAVVEENGKG